MTHGRIRPAPGEPDSVSLVRIRRTRLCKRSVSRRPIIALWWVVIALPMLCCLAIGCGKKAESEESEDEGPTTPVPVRAVVVRKTTLHPSIDLVGTLQAIPELTAIVSPQAGGWIDSVEVVEGQTIKARDALVNLDARTANNALTRAKAVVKERTAVWERLDKGYRKEEKEAARQDAEKAKQTVKGLQQQFDALKPLRERNEVPLVVYNKARSDLKAAMAGHAAAAAKLALMLAGTRKEQKAEAQAQLDTAIADQNAADLAVKFCTITSPIGGTVTQLLARRGAFIERATPLATIVDLSHLFVVIRVPAAQTARVRAGQVVEVSVASLPGKEIPGKIVRRSGQADPATGNMDAFAKIANEHDVLRPGMVCRVRVSLPDVPKVIAIPLAAVADHSGTSVVTIVRDKKAYEVEVKTGVETAKQVEILSGLSPGDVVVTAGGYSLPEKCPVTVTLEKQPNENKSTKP